MIEIIITVFGFLGYLVWRELQYTKHIKDLEIKLMSRSTSDYAHLKAIDSPEKIKPTKSEDDHLIDTDEVDPVEAVKGQVK